MVIILGTLFLMDFMRLVAIGLFVLLTYRLIIMTINIAKIS